MVVPLPLLDSLCDTRKVAFGALRPPPGWLTPSQCTVSKKERKRIKGYVMYING